MKKSKIYFLLLVLGLMFNACTYDFIVPEELPKVDPTVDVLFSTQIVPVFTAKCVSCHKSGGQAPDLSSAKAYSSLNSLNLINTTTPASSKIYAYPGSSSHAWAGYSTAEAQLILTWIQKGAKNN